MAKRPCQIDGWEALAAFGYVLFAGLILALIIFGGGYFRANAHGAAEWIQRGGYKNALGELCCGERDCAELADADVKVTANGYYIASTKETVPFHEATPSPTGTYWRCYWGGKRKCFFFPPPNT